MFGEIYAGRRVLVTGHTGFKGSWLVLWLQTMGAQVSGLALNPDTEPSHWSTLGLSGVADYRVDLRDLQAVRRVLDEFRPEIVFHLAAQPLVRRSYRDPVDTFTTNVMGLINLFEATRHCPEVRVLVNATTDKVYAERNTHEGYQERDALGGHDPYSTSKACAELVSDCYRKSYLYESVRVATARAGNVIGGGDWAEDRLVPDLVRAAISGKSLLVRHPLAVRPWQHVLEPLSGYLSLGQRLWNGAEMVGSWNFGPEETGEISVQSLAERLSLYWPALHIEHDGATHPHEAETLRLNWNKARQQLGWRPVWGIEKTLANTAAWYRCFHEDRRVISLDELKNYVGDARRQGLEWAQ